MPLGCASWMQCSISPIWVHLSHRTPLQMRTHFFGPLVHDCLLLQTPKDSGLRHRKGKCDGNWDQRGRTSWKLQDEGSEAFRSLKMNTFKWTKWRVMDSFLEVDLWWVFQVLLPLVDQYFTNHRLYFLSSPLKPLSSSGYASHKEKEMVARWVSKIQRRLWCWLQFT